MTDTEPAPTSSVREKLLAHPDIYQVLAPTPSVREKLLARDDIDQILEEDLSDVPNPSRRRWFKRLPALTAAGALLMAGVSPPGATKGTGEATQTQPKVYPTESPVESARNFNELIRPLIEERGRRREAWAKDPDHRGIDKELNANLINFAVVAWSQGRGESLTVLSYNLITGKVTTVSCTRETITPEVIKFNKQKHPDRKDIFSLGNGTNMFAYGTGGFDLVRKVIENETGLSADFGIYMDDEALYDFIKDVAGDEVEIEVKEELHLKDAEFDKRWGWDPNGFVLKPSKYKMTARQALRYIMASDIETKPGKVNSPPGRKNDIVMAALHAASDKFQQDSNLTLAKFGAFLGRNKLFGHVDGDFDLIRTARAVGEMVGKIKSGQAKFGLPEVEKDDLMINDEFFGDGGLMRVHRFLNEYGEPSNEYYKYAHPNMQRLVDRTIEIMRELKQQGISIDDVEQRALVERGGLPMWAQVPILGDPETSDSITGWWPSTRQLTKQRLLPTA